jgi:hypothetical protein
MEPTGEVGDGRASASEVDALEARARENGELVDGGRRREDTGPCLAGWRGDGEAQRVARGSRGGAEGWSCAWPGCAHGVHVRRPWHADAVLGARSLASVGFLLDSEGCWVM